MDFDFTSEAPGFKSKRNSTESWMFGKTVIQLEGLPGRVEGSVNYRLIVSEQACGQLGVTDDTNILTIWDKKEIGLFIGNVTSLRLAKSDQLSMSKVQQAAEIKRARVVRNKTVLEGLGKTTGVGYFTLEPCLEGQAIPVAKLVFLGKDESCTDALTQAENTFIDVLTPTEDVPVMDPTPVTTNNVVTASVSSLANDNPFEDEEPDNVLDTIVETASAPGNADGLSW